MDSYTITIAPNDDSGNSTTLIVDTSEDAVRITDVRLHAAGGLTGGQMPTIDFGLLLSAVAGSSVPTAIEAVPASAPVADPEPAAAPAEEAPAPEPVTAVAEPEPAPAAKPKPRRAKRTPAPAAAAAPVEAPVEVPAPAAAPRSTARRAPAAKGAKASAEKASAEKVSAKRAPVARKQAAKKTVAEKTIAEKTVAEKTVAEPAVVETETEANGRAYRRMPEDFAAVYRQASSPAAIADHYSVPRHTAQGWIRRQKATDAAAS